MTTENDIIPEEFSKIIKDFIGDLKTTFPEYVTFINKWWSDIDSFNYIEDEEERNKMYTESLSKSVRLLYDFCKIKFPPRIFDILYQNEEMFKETSEIDTEFLPKIHFKNLWQCDISEKTRTTIWKYLQLIMFAVIGSLDKKESFGDTAKLFENINQDEFKNKLEETLSHMQGLFEPNVNETESENLGEGINIPDAQQLHDHITGMLDGKLGKLAREIAEETAADLNDNFENATDMKDIFQNIVKNPSKMMGLVKSVSEKLDTKIKSGELKESEIIAEATNIMNQMKGMPGMDNIQSMLSTMGLGNLGNLGNLGGKVNTGAMEVQLNNKMKIAKMKERIRTKAEANAKSKMEQQIAMVSQQNQSSIISDEEIIKLFSSVEKVEKSPRGSANNNNKKKNTKK